MRLPHLSLSLLSLLLLLVLIASPVAAEGDDEAIERVKQSLALLLPNIEPEVITKSEVPGLYEVVIGTRIVYVSGDGRYLIQGSVIDLELRENITQPKVDKLKLAAIEGVGEDNMIIYEPETIKHTITVFTDIDCGFCRKLHSEMAGYNEKGIRVRYLFYPRAGVNSASYRKAVSVWCADDRIEAMNIAKKTGNPPEEKSCENPVKRHMLLGEMMGVTGTPALMLEDGEMLPGYVPPDRLIAVLDERKNAK